MKRFVLAIAAIALVVSGVAAQGTIKIGGIWTLADITGKQGSADAQLAVDAINAAGGISGKTLQLIVADDEGKADTAAAAVEKPADRKSGG